VKLAPDKFTFGWKGFRSLKQHFLGGNLLESVKVSRYTVTENRKKPSSRVSKVFFVKKS
jgi:hypothetical protein